VRITVRINGEEHRADCWEGESLLFALREKLVRLRGVREAMVVPEEGIARLTVYPESFDERAATEIIGGES